MKLTRICSEFSYGDWIIHRFGVNDAGDPIHNQSEFRDYFYFKADQIGLLSPFDRVVYNDTNIYTSIYGDETLKVEYTSIKERKSIEEAYPQWTFEADVKPEFKYLMETRDTWTDSKDRHIFYFDIETWSDETETLGFADANNPHAPITSIQGYSTKLDRYVIFTWHETETEDLIAPQLMERGNRIFVFCRDEEDVINSFFLFLKDYSVDLITGWWSAGFDLPYIVNRCVRMNIDIKQMSPVNNVMHYNKNGEWKTYITGLDHVDMLEAVHEVGYNLSNNKLDTAAKEIIGDDYGKTEEGGWKYWKTDYKKFLEYSIRDVEILKRIDDTLGIFSLYCTIQKMTNITNLNDVSFKSSVVDKFILSECHGDMVFPTRRTAEKQKYMGATVLDPTAGLYENVGVVDYASLYPTSIMSFNLSPETFICSDKLCNDRGIDINDIVAKLDERGIKYVDTGFNHELFGGRYLFYAQEERVGLLPRILKKMYAERRRIKAEMKKTDDPVLLNALDHHQLTLKIVLNSAYGAFGFNYFRLYKPEVADAITFFARRALEFAINGLEEFDQRVIYGDTDSAFFVQSSGWSDHHKKWERWFANELKETFIGKYNNGCTEDYQMMELEYEKDLERIYFGDSKKRYYGIERNTGKKYIKGLNIIRKDAPPFLKVKLNEITEMVVRNQLTLDHILDLRKEIESIPYEQLAITKKFSKRFELYQKNQPQHLKGAKFANEILGTSIDHRDMPYLFYIVSHCEGDKKKADRNKAICLLDEHLHFIDERKDLFELDYDTYFQKQVIDQLMEFEHIPYLAKIIEEYKRR